MFLKLLFAVWVKLVTVNYSCVYDFKDFKEDDLSVCKRAEGRSVNGVILQGISKSFHKATQSYLQAEETIINQLKNPCIT